jgi:predicted nicotinamide N-methyase
MAALTLKGADSKFMETPLQAVAEVVRESVFVEGQTILIDRPADSDRLLDDPSVADANRRDDYMPYWADIWPASRMLAKAIFRERWTQGSLEAIELGCGLGLAGIAALKCGQRVTFTDYDLTALRFAQRNATLNGCIHFCAEPLDWRRPPTWPQVPIIFGADVAYEARLIVPLVETIRQLLLPGGICLLTDPDRKPALLRSHLAEAGLCYDATFIRAGEPGRDRTKGTIYRIRKKAEE